MATDKYLPTEYAKANRRFIRIFRNKNDKIGIRVAIGGDIKLPDGQIIKEATAAQYKELYEQDNSPYAGRLIEKKASTSAGN